jgi:hypothetical protein
MLTIISLSNSVPAVFVVCSICTCVSVQKFITVPLWLFSIALRLFIYPQNILWFYSFKNIHNNIRFRPVKIKDGDKIHEAYSTKMPQYLSNITKIICPPQIPYVPTRARMQASSVKGRLLTSRTMAWSLGVLDSPQVTAVFITYSNMFTLCTLGK